MKQSVTQAEYLQLVGLKALADDSTDRLKWIRAAVHELLQATPDNGYIDDFIYSDETVEWLLNGIGIDKEQRSSE